MLLVPDETEKHSVLDRTTSLMVPDESWNPSYEWDGPPTTFYRSFDGPDGLNLMEGTVQVDHITLVSGKVRSIINLCHIDE